MPLARKRFRFRGSAGYSAAVSLGGLSRCGAFAARRYTGCGVGHGSFAALVAKLGCRDGGEDECEAHRHAGREHLSEERHAEQRAEHAFKRTEQPGLGGGQVRLRHVLRHGAEGRREHGHVGHGADELGRGDLRHSGHRLRDQGEQQG